MSDLKSISAGLVGALAAIVLSAVAVILGAFTCIQFEIWRQSSSGGVGAVSAGIVEMMSMACLPFGALGLVAGLWWFRRANGRRRR